MVFLHYVSLVIILIKDSLNIKNVDQNIIKVENLQIYCLKLNKISSKVAHFSACRLWWGLDVKTGWDTFKLTRRF